MIRPNPEPSKLPKTPPQPERFFRRRGRFGFTRSTCNTAGLRRACLLLIGHKKGFVLPGYIPMKRKAGWRGLLHVYPKPTVSSPPALPAPLPFPSAPAQFLAADMPVRHQFGNFRSMHPVLLSAQVQLHTSGYSIVCFRHQKDDT